MRFVIILLGLVLASCVTPKTAPQSYYAGVYTPGKVEIKSGGYFIATAGVIAEDDVAVARKAAYARFMLEAKKAGYRSFSVEKEQQSKLIGTTFKLSGKVYKSDAQGDGVYALDAIKRLLQDLPLEQPKPVYVAPVTKVAAAKPRKVASRKTVPPVGKVNTTPAAAPTEDPLVIMAPTDITGSVKKAGTISPSPIRLSTSTISELERPDALSEIPNGVMLKRR